MKENSKFIQRFRGVQIKNKQMKHLKLLFLAVCLGITLDLSAQETNEEAKKIENFELPTFFELSHNIATEYTDLLESLPDLSNIGPYIDQELRQSSVDEHSTVFTVRNFVTENSILATVSSKRFQLRNSLNNIMFTGYDIGQLQMNNVHKTTGN